MEILNTIIEIVGVLSGLLYIFLSIRQDILCWPFGILSSLIYIYVYFTSGFYADMSIQVYYVFIGIYGWYYWVKGTKGKGNDDVPVVSSSLKTMIILISITLLLFVIIGCTLLYATDSEIPFWDAFTTALSITATWMLAKKIIEHWLFWIIADIVSMGLYIYKGLYPSVILFAVYTVMAIIGYIQWKKSSSTPIPVYKFHASKTKLL
jgi:nicotinamide mononucleotide transporter